MKISSFTLEDFLHESKNSMFQDSVYGIWCENAEDDEECRVWLDSVGLKWSSGDSYLTVAKKVGEIVPLLGEKIHFAVGTFAFVINEDDNFMEDRKIMTWKMFKEACLGYSPDISPSEELEELFDFVIVQEE